MSGHFLLEIKRTLRIIKHNCFILSVEKRGPKDAIANAEQWRYLGSHCAGYWPVSLFTLPPSSLPILLGASDKDNINLCAPLKTLPGKGPTEELAILSNLRLEIACWILIPEASPNPQAHRLRVLSENSNNKAGIR